MKHIITILTLATLFVACSHKDDFDATGTFESTEVTLSTEAAGRILSLPVQEGDTICSGNQIGAIDSTQLYLSKLQLLKNIKSISASRPNVAKQIATTIEQIAKQKTEKKRVENLLRSNAATQKQLDDINSNIRVLESQLAAQKSSLQNSTESINAQMSALDIQIAQIEDKLSKCRIISPLNGIVCAKYAQAGELATVGKPILKIANLSQMYLRAYVSSEQLANLKIGQQVNVEAQFGRSNNRKYKGRIVWIASQSEFTPKNIQTKDSRADMVYAIKIAVSNDGYIKIGTYAQVLF